MGFDSASADRAARGITRTSWVAWVGADHLFTTLPTAVATYEQWLRDYPQAGPADDQAARRGTKVPTIGDQ
jgi:hypothetical protein